MITHVHPISGVTIEGELLPPGSILRTTDKYDSTDGTWSTNENVVGLTLQANAGAIWIRESVSPAIDGKRQAI